MHERSHIPPLDSIDMSIFRSETRSLNRELEKRATFIDRLNLQLGAAGERSAKFGMTLVCPRAGDAVCVEHDQPETADKSEEAIAMSEITVSNEETEVAILTGDGLTEGFYIKQRTRLVMLPEESFDCGAGYVGYLETTRISYNN